MLDLRMVTQQAEPGIATVASRREALRFGLVAAGAIGLGPAPRTGITFGATLAAYPKLHAAVPQAVGLRMYIDRENHFPPVWPTPYPGAWMTLSMRPNPSDLLSGKLDDQFRAVIDSAPAHSELTFWHENTTGNPLGYPPYVNNARAAVQMQHYGHSLCRGTQVRFGAITCGPAMQQVGWLAPGLDWYGDDLYEFPQLRGPNDTMSQANLLARLESNLEAWRITSGSNWPSIRICETNSPFDSHRRRWFTWMAQWLAGHNGSRMLTYWNPNAGIVQGGLSGPWPPSQAVVGQLRWLCEKYKGTARRSPQNSPDAQRCQDQAGKAAF